MPISSFSDNQVRRKEDNKFRCYLERNFDLQISSFVRRWVKYGLD